MNLFTPAETVANYAAAGAVKTQQTFGKLLLLGAWVPVMFFVVAGFSHSIADMTYCALALFARDAYAADASALTWGRYFLGNMLPVTLGNIVGGLLVGGTAWYCYLRKKG